MPLSPYFRKPTCNGYSFCRSSTLKATSRRFSRSGFCVSAYGVSLIDLPAYLVISGFGSNDSACETPPFMKSQTTLFAFGAKCGFPFGGCQASGSLARTMPSRASIAPHRPVNPRPKSARNVRRSRERWRLVAVIVMGKSNRKVSES